MKLYQIKDDKCPECGARAIAQTQDGQHSNMQWNESRTFECGCVIKWEPCFSALKTVKVCPKNKLVIEKKAKGEAALVALDKFISGLDIDTEFEDNLRRAITYSYYHFPQRKIPVKVVHNYAPAWSPLGLDGRDLEDRDLEDELYD